MPLERILEPEVMDSVAEAVDYDAMDHSEVNRRFVDQLLLNRNPSEFRPETWLKVLDVGTGTAQIPIELARRESQVHITAIDLAHEMLKLGQQNVTRAGVAERVKLEYVDAKQLPYAAASFRWVISNSILHHIPEPLASFSEMHRVLAPDGLLFIRDLLRPSDLETLNHLVQTYTGGGNSHQRKMFADSLHAALSIEDVQELLEAVGLPRNWVTQTTDRHWTICGRLER